MDPSSTRNPATPPLTSSNDQSKEWASFPRAAKTGKPRPLAESDTKLTAMEIHNLLRQSPNMDEEGSPPKAKPKRKSSSRRSQVKNSPPPTIILTNSSPTISRHGKSSPPTASLKVHYNDNVNDASQGPEGIQEDQEIEEVGVSEDFINKYNTLFGDPTMHKQANRMSISMRELAGLNPSSSQPINISEARIGLCLLAGLKDEQLKTSALSSLEEILSKDQITPATAENITTFASNFFNLIIRKGFKEERPPIQQQFRIIYDWLLSILQKQFEAENIGSITPDLKSQLTIAGIVLGKVSSTTVFDAKEYAINIPQARFCLCELVAQPEEKLKMDALNSLEYILRNDPCTEETASRLVEFSISYLNLINRQEFQKETTLVRMKMIEVFHTLMILFNCQYINKNIGAITNELKTQFTLAAKGLRNLDTQDNVSFKYNARCALMGARRLQDDNEKLFTYLNRVFQIVAGVVSLGVQEADAGFGRIERELKTIDFRGKNKWYDNVLILKKLAKEAFHSSTLLNETLHYIGLMMPDPKDKKKEAEHKWEFYYAAAKMLRETCLKGETAPIRLLALTGASDNSPGLRALAGLELLKLRVDKDRVKRLKSSHKIDTNVYIRDFAIDCLSEIVKKSQDRKVIMEAKRILQGRVVDEKTPSLCDKLQQFAPRSLRSKVALRGQYGSL